MSNFQPFRHQVSIAGQVKDAITGKAMKNVKVKIIDAPRDKISQLKRTQTDTDGWFYFIDLPHGSYQLEASLPSAGRRYDLKQSQPIEVEQDEKGNVIKRDGDGNIVDNLKVELELTPTTILGKVTGSDDQEGIGMAKVEIQGTGEYTFSSKEITSENGQQWNYRLVGIEASNNPLKIRVSAPKHSSAQKEVSLAVGEVKSLDFKLS